MKNYKVVYERQYVASPKDVSIGVQWEWFDNASDALAFYRDLKGNGYRDIYLYANTPDGWILERSKNLSEPTESI